MERVSERIALAQKALATFQELAKLTAPSLIERDAAIQRFEYSFEAVWKATQRYLQDMEGIDATSPKAVIRAALRSALLNETEARQALQMADDRNLTSHTYHEAVAKLIFSRASGYATLMHVWVERLQERLRASRLSEISR
nr:HI0074 family nucleotidyltransferase substrate-binding subunit [Gammaproteobacteria bacterium]